MTKKERNDSEQEQADAEEAIDILRAIRKSLIWTYGGTKENQSTNPEGFTIPTKGNEGVVGRMVVLLDKLTPMPVPTRQRQYYAMHDAGLENGSFYRDRNPSGKGGFAHYMNGDFMGFVDKVEDGRTLQDRDHACKLVPKICRD